jgi:hypothetical protein
VLLVPQELVLLEQVLLVLQGQAPLEQALPQQPTCWSKQADGRRSRER